MARPSTAAEMLDTVASYLDLADRAVAAIARAQGREYIPGSTMQNDLRMMAAWMREHPDVDAQITDCVTALPGK